MKNAIYNCIKTPFSNRLSKQLKINMNSGHFTQLRKYRFTLKLTNSVNDALSKAKNIEIPKKLKGTFVERWGIYWKNLYIDYRDAAVDAAKDCKEHPIRTSIYASSMCIYVSLNENDKYSIDIVLASCVYLHKHNPDETSFRDHMLQNSMKIMQVGEAIRNPVSEHYVKWLGKCYNEGIVRRMNLGIISLIWLDDYDKMCSLYKAICPYLKVQYVTFHHRIVDVGFLDKWWILDSKMKDYDVNDAEFSNLKDE